MICSSLGLLGRMAIIFLVDGLRGKITGMEIEDRSETVNSDVPLVLTLIQRRSWLHR